MMVREQSRGKDTAISPTIGVILMVAIVVVIAAVVGTAALGIGSGTSGTTQADIDARIIEDGTYSGASDIVLTHKAGDEIPVKDIELQMSMPSGKVTVENLPVNATTVPCPTIAEVNEEHTAGGDGFLRGGSCWTGRFADTGDDEKTWAPGDRGVVFVRALKQSGASPSMEFGDTVEVTVVDEGTETVVDTAEFTVGE